MTTTPLNVAIVGAGLMGRWHAHNVARAGGRLVAVADSDVSAARRLADRHRTLAFPSLDNLLATVNVNAVHICTPLDTHIELATRALDAGAHVLVEKPLAPDATSTAQLLAHAQARERFIVPVHQFIFQDGVQRTRAHIHTLAPIVHMELTAVTAGADGADNRARDQLAADILPHALSLFQYFLPRGVDDIAGLALHPAPGELRALARFDDISLAITISTHGRPTRNEFTLIGARGTLHADLFHGFAVVQHGAPSRAQKIIQPFAFATRSFAAATTNLASRALHGETAYPGLRALLRAFYHAIAAGMPPPIAPQATLAIARARDELTAELNTAMARADISGK
ncbi:MAG: Gfo/Idh/MocA family oxidoreductase [Chloroflexota bacterium]